MKTLDLRGYACPIPQLKTREALKEDRELTVIVDEPAARENITKFAKSQNLKTTVSQDGFEFTLHICG